MIPVKTISYLSFLFYAQGKLLGALSGKTPGIISTAVSNHILSPRASWYPYAGLLAFTMKFRFRK